jgi:hypothetical protein
MRFSSERGAEHIDDKVLSAEEERGIIEQSATWKAHVEEHGQNHTNAELIILDKEPIKKESIFKDTEGISYFKQAPAMGCACGKVSFKIDDKNSVHEYAIAEREKQQEYTTDSSPAPDTTYKK